MNKLKKIVFVGMILSMLISLAGCNTSNGNVESDNVRKSTNSDNVSESKNSVTDIEIIGNAAMGRFVEEEYSIPDNTDKIFAIKKLQDSSVCIITDTSVFQSKDGGRTWEVNEQIDLSRYTNENSYIYQADIDLEGNIFLCHTQPKLEGLEAEGTVFQTTYINKNGENQTSDMQVIEQEEGGNDVLNMLMSVEFTLDGDIAALDLQNNIRIMNPINGEIKNLISKDDTYRSSIHCVGNILIVQTISGAEIFDMTGNLLETDSTISNLLSSAPEINNNTGALESLLIEGEGGNGFYYCNHNGLYHYTLGGAMTELLISGELNHIGDTSYIFQEMAAKEDNSFLILFRDGNSDLVLKNYTYSDEIQVTPSNELVVYSLYDNQTVRQAISIFNNNNQDIYVCYEIGMYEDSSMTELDAIKTLSTSIMTGNGPDILILDKLSIQSYIDKGVLADISDVVKEVSDTEGLFKNISNSYEVDGKIYAVPARFSVPLIVGDTMDIAEINDLDTLAEKVTELKTQNPDLTSIIGMYDNILLETLFDISAATWIHEDGTLDKEKLTEFLEVTKRIHDIQAEGVRSEDINELNELNADYTRESNLVISQIFDVQLNRQKFAIIGLGSISDFRIVPPNTETMNTLYKVADGQSQNTYIPLQVIGISAKSTNVTAAAKFIKYYLTAEAQNIKVEEGLPINIAAFDEIGAYYVEWEKKNKEDPQEEVAGGDGAFSITEEILLEDEISSLKNMIGTLNTPALMDSIIKETVKEEGAKYIVGETTLEETVSAILQKINIYLAE